MELFVLEIANYLLRRDEESLMKEAHRERRKQERSQILTHHLFDRLSPIEAVQEMLNMDREPEYKYVIPVRYPESEFPDMLDLVEFTFPESIFRGLRGVYEEILEEQKRINAEDDRISSIENAYIAVAAKHHGSWRYIDQDIDCLEVI